MIIQFTIQLYAALFLLFNSVSKSHASRQSTRVTRGRKLSEFCTTPILSSAVNRNEISEDLRDGPYLDQQCDFFNRNLNSNSKKMLITVAIVSGLLFSDATGSFASGDCSPTSTSSYSTPSTIIASSPVPSSPIRSSPLPSSPLPSSPIRSSPLPSSPIPSSPIRSSPLPSSPIPSSPIRSSPLPSSPLPSSPIRSSPLSSIYIPSTQLLSLSPMSSSTSAFSSPKYLQGPEIQNVLQTSTNQDQAQVSFPTGIRESIAKGAASIPGFGQPDVYYPPTFSGKWEVEQTYTDITEKKKNLYFIQLLQQRNNLKTKIENENEKKNEIVENSGPKSFTVKWISKFIPINGKIILDRSYAETSKYNVLLKNDVAVDKSFFQIPNEDQKQKKENGEDEKNLFVISKWDYSNPNVLTVSTSDNKVIGTKVTKRAVENDLPQGSFGYSEYSQVFESETSSSVPKIFGMRVLKRFKEVETYKIQGVERIYIYDEENLDLNAKEKPLAVIKSSFVMKKIE